jgi:hypothetical protein
MRSYENLTGLLRSYENLTGLLKNRKGPTLSATQKKAGAQIQSGFAEFSFVMK